MSYGDGVSDVDAASLRFHAEHGRLATVTAVQPPGRFGALEVEGERISGFVEKPTGDGGWINGGFFVLNPRALDYIDGDQTIREREPLQRLAADNQLTVIRHTGFWHPMDTMRDKTMLEELWASGTAPWKRW